MRIDPYLTAPNRRRIFVLIAIAAFLYANLRAYDQERELKERAIAEKTIYKPALNPTMLYQDGYLVGSIRGEQINIAENRIVFDIVTAVSELNMSRPFEFRDWKLSCQGQAGGSLGFGAMRQINYQNFTCRIQGAR